MSKWESKLFLRHVTDEISFEMLSSFDCGRESLNEFLKHDAINFHKDNLTKTTIVFHEQYDGIIAFFSLSSDSVLLTRSERGDLGLNYDSDISFFPAIKITKLAIDLPLQGKKLGTHIINIVLGLLQKINNISAVRLITVDAVNEPKILDFYAKCGFVNSIAREKERKSQAFKETILMIKDLYI